MTQYQIKNRLVEAWQWTNPDPDVTAAWPSWVLALATEGRLREMPDGSLHIDRENGAVYPLPMNYWLILNDDGSLGTAAPDVFEIEYELV